VNDFWVVAEYLNDSSVHVAKYTSEHSLDAYCRLRQQNNPQWGSRSSKWIAAKKEKPLVEVLRAAIPWKRYYDLIVNNCKHFVQRFAEDIVPDFDWSWYM
jgi:hypothetical protein